MFINIIIHASNTWIQTQYLYHQSLQFQLCITTGSCWFERAQEINMGWKLEMWRLIFKRLTSRLMFNVWKPFLWLQAGPLDQISRTSPLIMYCFATRLMAKMESVFPPFSADQLFKIHSFGGNTLTLLETTVVEFSEDIFWTYLVYFTLRCVPALCRFVSSVPRWWRSSDKLLVGSRHAS